MLGALRDGSQPPREEIFGAGALQEWLEMRNEWSLRRSRLRAGRCSILGQRGCAGAAAALPLLPFSFLALPSAPAGSEGERRELGLLPKAAGAARLSRRRKHRDGSMYF